jgi:primosomal protein N' (replication factor Y)
MLVVATPGAEPVAEGGYGAALLLDAHAALGRPDLRAAEETLRRWMGAAALVQSREAGGEVVVVADGGLPVVQALLRWDPVAFAEREAADRSALHFPPAVRMAAIEGDPDAIHDAITVLSLPAGAELLGPVEIEGGEEPMERVILRIERSRSAELSASLRALAALRSTRKSPGKLRIRLDPRDAL